MNEKTKLTLSMGILYLLIILTFGLIIINEKKETYLKPKITKKITNYIKEKYPNQKFTYSKIIFLKNKYSMKISHPKNKNLYYTVTYQNKKITDTYKKDYLEGKTLTNYITKKLNKEINLTNYNINITYNIKLNKCTDNIKNELINNNYYLPLYTINVKKEITNNNQIKNILLDLNNTSKSINITPKNYNITLSNKTTPSKSINLIIEPSIIDNNLDEVITLITNNDKTTLKKYNVTYSYLN